MTRILFLVTLAAVGCDKKDTSTAAPAQAEAKPETPADANSEKFGMNLVGLNITDFRPMDAGAGKFVYETLSFEADNSWRGDGYIEIAGETMECVESGSWKMDPAESATVAVMTWTVGSTDCINMTEGDRRYKVTISSGDISVEYR